MMKAPTFLSVAGQFSVTVGDTVRLPCQVDRLQVSLQNKYTWLEHESATMYKTSVLKHESATLIHLS